MSGVENFNFHEKRETENKSLRKIKEEIIQKAASTETKRHISDTIIASLNSDEGLRIVRWDTLAHISSLTAVWNKLRFYPEADHIDIGDIITIRNGKLLRNGSEVWEVISGYEVSTTQAIASVRSEVEDIIPTRKPASKLRRSNEATRTIEANNTYGWWRQLVRFIENEWYKRWAGAWLCWKNVWDTLNRYYTSYGINAGLPTSQRHGWKWDNFLRWNPHFLRIKISHPSEAPNGSIISYAAWEHFDWSNAKKAHGHVEIKTASNMFYFGWINRHPGWSANANTNLQKSGFTGYAYVPRYIQTDERDYQQDNLAIV